jgi:threonine dehydratase
LIAGVATVVEAVRPEVRVVGVEPANAAGFTAALRAGKPVDIALKPTLADGLAVGRVGEVAFAQAAPLVDRVVTVDEAALALAVLRLAELEKSVVEGAGAAPLAACMASKLPELANRRTVLLLTGGNIDLKVLNRVIEKGLVADGRLCRFTAVISDRPGGLARLAQIIAQAGASIQDIAHERAFSGPDVTAAHVSCTVETVDREHEARLYDLLRQNSIDVLPLTPLPNATPPTAPSRGA